VSETRLGFDRQLSPNSRLQATPTGAPEPGRYVLKSTPRFCLPVLEINLFITPGAVLSECSYNSLM
jgi:hypothetical protein